MAARLQYEYVAITGHSFVYWLQKFIEKDATADEHFGTSGCQVDFLGKRGGKVADVMSLMEGWRVPQNSNKAIVIVCGGNDVKKCPRNKEESHCQKIVDEIIELATQLKDTFGTHDSCKVIVCQVMPRCYDLRCPYNFDSRYNIKAEIINKALREQLAHRHGMLFWSHATDKIRTFGAFLSEKHEARRKYLREDGVHLNDMGNFRLYTSICRVLRLMRR